VKLVSEIRTSYGERTNHAISDSEKVDGNVIHVQSLVIKHFHR